MVGQVEGQIWDSEQGSFVSGVLRWDQRGVIESVQPAKTDRAIFVVPGFIDVHIHGAGGSDVMDATPQALKNISHQMVRYGVTGFVATTLTSTPKDLAKAVDAVRAFQDDGRGAQLLGLHLEGPYIDPDHRGAQPPDRIRPMDRAEMEDLLARGRDFIRIMTVAPEMPGALDGIAWLVEQGVRVNIGHTGCTLDVAERAADLGADGITHLFNAMPGLHHRNPGPVGLALSDSRMFVEIIADGVHINPHVVRMVYQAAEGRVMAITDGISAVGLPPGKHHLGELIVQVDERAVRLPSGTLAGSKLTLDQAYRNLLQWGVGEASIVRSLSETPWARLGFGGRGHLAPGLPADLVVLNEERTVLETIRQGQTVYQRS